MSGPVTLVLISQNDTLTQICQEKLQALLPGQKVEHFGDLGEFVKWTPGRTLCGAVIELKTLLSAASKDRNFFNDMGKHLPAYKVRLDQENGSIIGIAGQATYFDDKVFEALANEIKSLNTHRTIRGYERKNRILNVKVLYDGGGTPYLTNTVNISKGGMFVISGRNLEINRTVRLEVQELGGQPLEGVVRWVVPWGRSQIHYAGFGIEFHSLTPEQQENLAKLLL